MVALKLCFFVGVAGDPSGKQERRGGIETNFYSRIPLIVQRKQERRGGIETAL